MKIIRLIGIVPLLALLAACGSPYPGLTTMEYEELGYAFPVKHAHLRGDIRLAYADIGQGVPVFFIHGLGSYMRAWEKNVGTLSQSMRCLPVDLPGYGKSSKGRYPFSLEFYADVITELADSLGLKEFAIAGHSMGGQIAMVAALKYPHRITKLILASPAGFEPFTAGERQWFRDVATIDLTKLTPTHQIRANVAANFYNMPDDAEFMVTDRIALRNAAEFEGYCFAVAQSIKAMVNRPVIDMLDKIQPPTLIMFGENDNLIPNAYLTGGRTADIAAIGASRIPNNKLVMIPECGHFLQFEKPEVFNQEVVSFIEKGIR